MHTSCNDYKKNVLRVPLIPMAAVMVLADESVS